MHRIDTATADPDANGTGVAGFTDGNPGMAIPPTDLNASWFNTVQEELCNFITGQGITLTSAKNQLLAALRSPVGAAGLAAISATGGTSSGTGLKGTGGASNGIGVQGFGTGTGCGLEGSGASSPTATAATTGSGVVGRGGQTNGFGGEFFGKGSGAGGKATGGATGAGFAGVGGITDGIGVTGTGGGTNGPGGVFSGAGTGSGLTGSNTASGYGVAARGKTSSPVRAALWIEPQGSSDPSNPAQGDTYVNSTSGLQSGYDGSHWARYNGTIFAMGSNSGAVSNVATLTAFSGAVVTIKANTLRVGSRIKVRAKAHVTSVAGGHTLQVYALFATSGGVSGQTIALAGDAADVWTPVNSNDYGFIEGEIVVQAIGASSACSQWSTSIFGGSSPLTSKYITTSVTIDTTVDNDVVLAGRWSVASGGDSVRIEHMTVEIS